MTLLHTVSLSGSIAMGIYLLLYVPAKRYLPVWWHKVYLTAAVFLFLVPLAYFKSGYTKLINRCLGVEAWYQKENVVKNLSDFTVFVYEDGVYISNLLMYILLLVSVLMGIGGMVLFMKRYITVYRKIMKGVVLFDRGNLVIKELIKDRKRPVNSKVYLCMGIKTPVTIGILHRKIVLPDTEWEEGRLKDALNHELVHVYSMDNLVKTFLILAVILNFYNPIVYYLWYKWNLVTELYCDNKVIENMSLQEAGNYANLIIDFAEWQGTAGLPIVGLNLSEKQLKERIDNMKNLKKTGKKYGKMSKVVGAFLIMAAVFASSLSVYAYEEVQVQYLDSESYETVEDFIWYDNWEDAICFNPNTEYNVYEKYIKADSIIVFVSENEIYYETDKSVQQYQIERACDHTYTSGTVMKHAKDNKGGCTVTYYDGKKCSKCGQIVCGDYIRSLSYAVCPH